MSRKWERMVQKNRKETNRQRQKYGKTQIIDSPQEHMDVFKGRSWFLPALLISCSFFFGVVSAMTAETDTFYYLTVSGYFLLGIIYFLRRPYIKVGKDKLSTRRLGVERFYAADEVSAISVLPGSVSIQLKGKRTRWVLSRFQNMYDIPAIAARLKKFAEQNGIEYTENAA